MRPVKLLAEGKQDKMILFVKNMLKEKYLSLTLGDKIKVDENSEIVTVVYEVKLSSGKKLTLRGTGSGPIDAAFRALKDEYSNCYSIKDLILVEFIINANLGDGASTDSQVETVLVVENNTRSALAFRNTSRSILRSSVEVCLKSVEYFVNSEEAIKLAHKCLIDAKKRNRGDLEQNYIFQLQKLMKYVQARELIKELNKNLRPN